MHKIETRTKNLSRALDIYDSVKGSRVSWRQKSSYRKPIKRRISKLMRREEKVSFQKQILE